MKSFCFAAIFLSLPVLAFASLFSTDIADIEADPRLYVGQTIRLRGEVTESVALPLGGLSLQTVYDRTGSILLLSSQDRMVSDRVRVRASVVGINTERAVTASSDVLAAIADAIEPYVEDPERADRVAGIVSRALTRLLPATDSALFLVEKQ